MFRLAMPALALAAGFLTSGAADQRVNPREAARFERALRGLTPGKPQDCITRERMGEMRSFPKTLLFVESRKRVWRNDTVGTCAGLKNDDLVVISSIGSRMCRGDIVHTRQRLGGGLTGSCALGQFVPYTK